MISGFRFLAGLGVLTGLLLTSLTQGASPVVPGFTRFHAGQPDAAGGQLLLGELNCISCHQPPGPASVARKQAPILDNVGGRVRLGHLRKFLNDPQAAKPGTTMPNVLAGDPQREKKVEALVQFLASTGGLRQERPDSKSIAPGRDLYQKVGCVACHGTRDAAGNADKVFPTSVPLGDLKTKYTIASLATFLENPHSIRPSGRMPRLLNAKEAREMANYLLQGITVDLGGGKGATLFSYYEGSWDKIPDFDKLKPKATGTAPGLDVGVAKRNNDFAIKFEGFLKLDREANYTFVLTSDDGGKIWVDGKVVVDHDGIHPPSTKRANAKLTKGVHKVTVGFMQGGGGAEIEVLLESPGQGQQNLGDLLAPTEAALEKKPVAAKKPSEDDLEINLDLAREGKELFGSLGCANCHQLAVDRKPIVSTLKAEPLAKLRGDGGCLSSKTTATTPWYGLNEPQTKALKAALQKLPAPPTTPAEIVKQTLTTFNCYACHVRDKVGGAEEDLNRFFLTTQPEMGDEGRLPPPLDGVGAKLNPDYFKTMLDKGADDRPYMHTRMPGFGSANVGHLVETFAKLDSLPKIPSVTFDQPLPRIKAGARHLVGGQAFGCIKCHTFSGNKAEGVQGIDMVLMPRRLQRDWFHHYILEPQRIRPGTRMPTGYIQGKSVLPDVLGGKADIQIEAMWVYLLDGNKAQLPTGLQRESFPLVAQSNAVIYRNFIEGAGTRAIGVGYPEKANLAFDANDMRLSLIWHGAFIDAAKHWSGRGQGFEGPLGDNILPLHKGVPFAVLDKADTAWPADPAKSLGYRFLGYRLSPDDRPTFLYTFGDVNIEDVPNPIAGKEVTLKRTLKLSATRAPANLHYRAAIGTKIETLGGAWYRVDGTWKVKLEGGETPVLRQAAGKTELLVPIRFQDGKAELIEEFSW